MEDSENYEYIECTPLLIGIGIESDDNLSEKNLIIKGKLQCPSCEYKTRRRDLLLSHTMLHEKESSNILSQQQQEPTEQQCAFTMLERGEQYFYKCSRCYYLTAAWPEIKRHIRRKHTVKSAYDCDWCTDYASPNLALLKRHVERDHWLNLPYRCETCKYSAWRLKEYQMHKTKKHFNDELSTSVTTVFNCTLCPAIMNTRKAFTSHLRKHSATYCEDCKRWVNNNNIDCHKARHANRKTVINSKRRKKKKVIKR